jgi:YihY family inner membrane protein
VLYGVMKKYGDDNGGVLTANCAFSAFLCVFPLLLIFVTVLNLVLVGDPSLRASVLHSTLAQFPVIGAQLGNNIHSLHRSSLVGLVIGLLFLIWGSTGFAQAGLYSMAQIWNVSGPDRPNYVKRLGRSVAFLGVLVTGVILSTFLAGFGTFGRHNVLAGYVSEFLAVMVNIVTYLMAFRVLTPRKIHWRSLVPGAVVAGIAWTILLALGGYLIGHDLRHDSTTYGTFGAVLGLMAWIVLGTSLTMYAAELNSVLASHLWPRGLVQPPLTEADQRSLTLQATQNQRRPEEEVSVEFSIPPMTQEDWLAAQATATHDGEDEEDKQSALIDDGH